ncbi:MAG: hypothetical protein EOO92_02630 [Pedobacter sp.]|nr:MAG: hypothetical protein EOO92_02630 [Pedobacter sp.]
MENSKENKAPEIETVTPDTDDGQPNDQKHNHRIENEVANAEEKPTSEEPKEDDATEVEPQDEEENSNPGEQPNDEGNPSDIETVSP